MNKKGMELSVNFFVILIITLVVFSFGIKLISSIFKMGNDYVKELDKDTERQIRASLIKGELTAIPINERTLKRGEAFVFGLGISNRIGEKRNFCVFTESSVGIPSNGADPIYSFDVEKAWTFKTLGPFMVENNDHQIISLIFNIPSGAVPGSYVFNVRVKDLPTTVTSCASQDVPKYYDAWHKITITVK